MQDLNYLNKKVFKYDLINKFYYHKTKNLPKLKKIILHFNCKNLDMKFLASSMLALKLVSNQKGKFSISKKANPLLKIKKKSPTGCKTILRNRIMHNFILKLFKRLLQKIKNFNTLHKKEKTKTFSIEINDTFNNFYELKSNFYFFNKLSNLKVTFVITSKIKQEIVFILKSYKLFLIKTIKKEF